MAVPRYLSRAQARRTARLQAPQVQAQPGGVGEALQDLGQFGEGVVQQLQQEHDQRQTRAEVIARVRDAGAFQQALDEEFNRFGAEADLTDPNTLQQFNEVLSTRAKEALNAHSGGDDSRARLSASIEEARLSYSRRMQDRVNGAQRTMLLDAFDGQLSQIGQSVLQGPGEGQDYATLIQSGFAQADAMLENLRPGLDFEDEMQLRDRTREVVLLNAIEPMLAAGNYEDVRDIIETNPMVMDGLPEGQQRRIVGQVAEGIRSKTRGQVEARNKAAFAMQLGKELGVQITPEAAFEAATGIDPMAGVSPADQMIDKLGIDPSTLPLDLKAALYGGPAVFSQALQARQGRQSRERIAGMQMAAKAAKASAMDTTGDFFNDPQTGAVFPGLKTINKAIADPLARSGELSRLRDQVRAAVDNFRETGNPQQINAAIQSFQRAVDEGAVVRDSDIARIEGGAGLMDRTVGAIERFWSGSGVTEQTALNILEASDTFANTALTYFKADVDAQLMHARRARLDPSMLVGEPQYNAMYAGVTDLGSAPATVVTTPSGGAPVISSLTGAGARIAAPQADLSDDELFALADQVIAGSAQVADASQ